MNILFFVTNPDKKRDRTYLEFSYGAWLCGSLYLHLRTMAWRELSSESLIGVWI
jgi:hypothetical protein